MSNDQSNRWRAEALAADVCAATTLTGTRVMACSGNTAAVRREVCSLATARLSTPGRLFAGAGVTRGAAGRGGAFSTGRFSTGAAFSADLIASAPDSLADLLAGFIVRDSLVAVGFRVFLEY